MCASAFSLFVLAHLAEHGTGRLLEAAIAQGETARTNPATLRGSLADAGKGGNPVASREGNHGERSLFGDGEPLRRAVIVGHPAVWHLAVHELGRVVLGVLVRGVLLGPVFV